jgi:hypothetical protein
MIFYFLKRKKESDFGKGLFPQEKPDERDYLHKEIAAGLSLPNWVEKKPEDFISYPIKNQGSTSACVAFSFAKQLEIDELSENGVYRILSPRSLYSLGYLPNGGMYDRQAATILIQKGMTLNSLLPSDNLTEQQMRDASDYKPDAQQVALVYKHDNIIFADNNLDTIASIIESYRQQGQKKGVGIIIAGSNNGTWLSTFPKPPASNETKWYHKVVATDYGLINGVKYISIDNSWGTYAGMQGKQFLGEDYVPFILETDYTLNLPDNWRDLAQTIPKPHYVWNNDLKIGSTGEDVLMLQKALQYLGMFPINSIQQPTGYFGGLTRQAVMTFQVAYQISPVSGIVGPLTRAKLNQLFGQ